MLSLLAFLAKTMGTPYRAAQMVARAMPLASAVRTMVISDTSKSRANSSAMSAISRVSTRWLRKPSTLMMFPGRTLPSRRMRSLSFCTVCSSSRSVPFSP